MLNIRYETGFKKDYKNVMKRGCNPELLEEVIDLLCAQCALPTRYKDHALKGNYANHRECHITPDWLLIYQIKDSELILFLTRTGTHADLF